MRRSYLRTGGTEADFWRLTARTYLTHMIDYHRAQRRAFEGSTYQTWLGAALTRQKTFPTFERLLKGPATDMADGLSGLRALSAQAGAGQAKTWKEWTEWAAAR